MKFQFKAVFAAGVALAFSVSGCAGMGGSTPAGTNAAAPSFGADAPPAVDGIAGHFAGKIMRGGTAVGTVTMDLSQAGTSAGGSAALKLGTLALKAAAAMNVATTGTTGTLIVIPGGASPTCSFAITKGKYDAATLMLSGKLSAFNGAACAGQSYTFKAKEQCYYVVATPKADVLTPRNFPKPC